MTYFLIRGNDRYGPYTQADLQRYQASGNVSGSDEVEPDGGGPRIRVDQLLADFARASSLEPHPQPFPLPAEHRPDYGYVSGPYAGQLPPGLPVPPALDWWLVLVLSLITCGLFGLVWTFIQARWLKKIDPGNRSILYLALYVGAAIIVFPLALGSSIFTEMDQDGGGAAAFFVVLYFFFGLCALFFALASIFSMKSSLEDSSRDWGFLRIDFGGAFGVLVVISFLINLLFVVVPAWMQYHLDKIRTAQTSARIGSAGYPYGR